VDDPFGVVKLCCNSCFLLYMSFLFYPGSSKRCWVSS